MSYNEKRKFEGKVFELVAIHRSKAMAEQYKNTIKRGGGLVRVVKVGSEYKIYMR